MKKKQKQKQQSKRHTAKKKKQNKKTKNTEKKMKRCPRYLHTHTQKYIYTCIIVDNRHAESIENCLSASNE